MFLQLTRTNGDPVMVNTQQVLHFYPLANGQTYFIFNGERFNLTVEEKYEFITGELERQALFTPPEKLKKVSVKSATA